MDKVFIVLIISGYCKEPEFGSLKFEYEDQNFKV
jgi:hypothetical protein